jgi:threonine efflux protein
MNGAADLLTFAGVMALGQFSPGPDMILMTRTALKCGVRSAWAMALGISTGLAVHATLAVAGIALILIELPVLREGLRWLAVVYLLSLAYRMLKGLADGLRGEVVAATAVESFTVRPFLRGFYCNLFNPKAAVFLAAVSAPFVRGEQPAWWPLALWGIIVGQGWLLWSLWAWLLQWRRLQQGYQRIERWMDGAFAVALLALAIRLSLG